MAHGRPVYEHLSNGGFAGPDGIKEGVILVLMSVVPIFTCMMAAYDGSLFALLAVTLGAVLIWGIGASQMPLPFLRRDR
jgi:hypothetical protein